jgi:hypothetical protein
MVTWLKLNRAVTEQGGGQLTVRLTDFPGTFGIAYTVVPGSMK